MNRFQRILVPLDGSLRAERALSLAARLARSVGGSITFLHMIPPLPVGESATGRLPATAQMVEREAQALLEAATYLGSVVPLDGSLFAELVLSSER